MKKIIALLLAVVMLFSLVACSGTNNTTDDSGNTTVPEREYDKSDPAAVLGEITADFSEVTATLTQKLTETFAAVGATYDDYQKNKGLIWRPPAL